MRGQSVQLDSDFAWPGLTLRFKDIARMKHEAKPAADFTECLNNLSKQILKRRTWSSKGKLWFDDSYEEMFRLTLPDLQITLEDQIQENDKVVTRFTIRASHRGALMGIATTGKRIKSSA